MQSHAREAQIFRRLNAANIDRLMPYAYRRFGKSSDVPIVLLQNFINGLDHWDPGNAGADDMAWLFFGQSEAERAAPARYWERRHARTQDVNPPSGMNTILAQVAAGRDWLHPHGERFAGLAHHHADVRRQRPP